MPPKQPASGANTRGAGATRGRGIGRGGGPAIPPSRPLAPVGKALPDTSSHVTTIGVKRPAFGSSGRGLNVFTNHFRVEIPEANIHHYDVISPSEKTLPARLNMEIIKRLQEIVAPDVFTPRAVYDGRKNLFAARELPLGPSGSQEFSFTLSDAPAPAETSESGGERTRGPKVYKVKLTHVATINPEVLRRFLQGKQSHDNTVLTAITALNVVIRMEPSLNYPFNVRSFFTSQEQKDIGGGIVLWRGYFQSVRPAIGQMLINVDISTGAMYKPGRAIDLALDFLERRRGEDRSLAPNNGLTDRDRIRLQRYLSGVRVQFQIPGQTQKGDRKPARVVKKLTQRGARDITFPMRDGSTITVAQYFEKAHNYKLKFPEIVCVEVGSGAILPLECCYVPEGQIMRKQIPPTKTKDVLDFATKRPEDRLASIRAGLGVLQYGQSEYVRQFGMHVPDPTPHKLQARVLDPPTLQYGQGSRQATIKPRDGAWNMIDKKFYRPALIRRWIVVIYERQARFRPDTAQQMVDGFLQAFAAVGIRVEEQNPIVSWQHPTGKIADQLKEVGRQCVDKHKKPGAQGAGPDLIVVVLPEASTDMYQAVKYFGDCVQGIATQCLKSSKCSHAKAQYFANVCLKINVKLGGINTIPDARSVPVLTDPHNPTLVMGADVIHPAPGADGRPSFTALVGNVDSDTAKYIADCRVQTSRQEMIDDLEPMAKSIIDMFKGYRTMVEKRAPALKRLIFYRDGVSEGQFQHVLDFELPQLKRACKAAGVEPKITILVVGKRHHVRFFPQKSSDADRSGNCPAGTVVDSDITHPTEFDWLLGTSRPAHYNVLYDENNFTPDSIQALSFALCHVYARSTRSVSIPAPVYYADIVCSRAKNHYDPEGNQDLSESATQLDTKEADAQLAMYKSGFRPLHANVRKVMYFS